MAELADAHGLGPCTFGCVGSTPTSGTNHLYSVMLFSLILFLNLLFHPSPSLAQDNNLQNDYEYTFSIYEQSYTLYQQSYQAYLKHLTLNTKELAIQHARQAQIGRLDTVRTFLYLVKKNLQTHQVSSPTETQILLQTIDQQIENLIQLSQKNQSATTLVDIQENNQNFLDLYEPIQELVYQSQIRTEANRLLSTLQKIHQLLETLDEGPIPNPTKQSWLDQTRKDIQLANDQINSALQIPEQTKAKKAPYQSSFKKSIDLLNQSRSTQERILRNALEIKSVL
jgi:hypothetical protein